MPDIQKCKANIEFKWLVRYNSLCKDNKTRTTNKEDAKCPISHIVDSPADDANQELVGSKSKIPRSKFTASSSGSAAFPISLESSRTFSSISRSTGEKSNGLTPLFVGQALEPAELASHSSHSLQPKKKPSYHHTHLADSVEVEKNSHEAAKHLI